MACAAAENSECCVGALAVVESDKVKSSGVSGLDMAAVHSQRHFICRCKFERNIFVKSLNKHVTYQNRQQFLEDYKVWFQFYIYK